MAKTKTPHKHAEVVKAWADGRSVQYRVNEEDKWKDSKSPSFTGRYQYRIKPEKHKCRVALFSADGSEWTSTQDFGKEDISGQHGFVRWMTDWIEVKV